MSSPHITLVEHGSALSEGVILLPQDDPAAQEALKTYVEVTDDDTVATELQGWLDCCSDQEARTDGGAPTPKPSTSDGRAVALGLSILVETPTTTVDTDGEAAIRVRPDHGNVRIEAAEDGDRTAETVLSGSPVAMATLADELYAAAATAAHDNDALDPLDGKPNE